MQRKKLFIVVCILAMVFGFSKALADDACTTEYFIKEALNLSGKLEMPEASVPAPEGFSPSSSDVLSACEKGIISYEKAEALQDTISKQDASGIIYNILVSVDPEFSISESQAKEILNSCYDNALISPENKIAYASMIRHGIISVRGLTYPDGILTKSGADTMISNVYRLFSKKLPVTVGDVTIHVGSSVDEVYSKLGEPDSCEYSASGVEWFVYSSNYKTFIIIGIKDDIVVGYFTNCQDFTKDEGVSVIRDQSGEISGAYYVPNPEDLPNSPESVANMLLHAINSHRAKSGLVTFIDKPVDLIPSLNKDTSIEEFVKGEDFIQLYTNLLMDSSILSYHFNTASQLTMEAKDGGFCITAKDSGSSIVSILGMTDGAAPIEDTQKDIKIKAPKIISPENNQKTEDKDLILQMKKACAKEYLVKVYNLEKERYDVNAYITTDDSGITIPGYMLTEGNMYRACIASVDGKEEIPGNTVVFLYKDAAVPLEVKSPKGESQTYEEEIHISAYSSAYRDLRIDVYNKDDEAILTKELKDEFEYTLDALPAGKYNICITAVSRATGEDMAQEFITVTIKEIVQKINQFVLAPGERYDFYYGNDNNWLYFYDVDYIEASQGQWRTRITQRKVPATKKYRQLRNTIPRASYTVGISGEMPMEASTEFGQAVCNLALSYKGVPYVWGGTTPKGFDCSGLVKYVFNKLGINNIPRTSAQQFAKAGDFVDKNALIPGDLVFFQNNGVIHHVGIYIGGGKMVHAPSTGDVVKVSSLQGSYFQREYAGAKRVSR